MLPDNLKILIYSMGWMKYTGGLELSTGQPAPTSDVVCGPLWAHIQTVDMWTVELGYGVSFPMLMYFPESS